MFKNLGKDIELKKFPGVTFVEQNLEGGYGIFRVSNLRELMDTVKDLYAASGRPLTDFVAKRIEGYISDLPNGQFRSLDGVPGLHAEVQALNFFELQAVKEGVKLNLDQLRIAVVRVMKEGKSAERKLGDPFPACANCKGIIPDAVWIITGRT